MIENQGMDKKDRILSIGVILIILITIWYMLDFVLLTFLITFLFYHLFLLIKKHNRKTIIGDSMPDRAIIIFIYVLVTGILTIIIVNLFPKIAEQTTELLRLVKKFDMDVILKTLPKTIRPFLEKLDFDKYVVTGGTFVAEGLAKIGGFALNVALSFILSFLLLLEKDRIHKFGLMMQDSKIGSVYGYMRSFGRNFTNTFGKVISVQALISTINAIVSTILLTILGFPQVMALGFMIWILGFIPVAGVLISLIPLSIIAFVIGGATKMLMVWGIIVIIHTIEAYVLNPKFMSNKTELPVCFVFIILLVSEHYLGVWGLLIGVPLFIFLMNALDVNFQEEKKKTKYNTKNGK